MALLIEYWSYWFGPDEEKIRKPTDREIFFRSKEWKEMRLFIFSRDGRKCSLCGDESNLQIDHIKPRSKFKHLQLEPSNLRVLCWKCNREKGTKI